MVLQDFGRGRVSACTGIRSVVLNCYNQRRVLQQNRTNKGAVKKPLKDYYLKVARI